MDNSIESNQNDYYIQQKIDTLLAEAIAKAVPQITGKSGQTTTQTPELLDHTDSQLDKSELSVQTDKPKRKNTKNGKDHRPDVNTHLKPRDPVKNQGGQMTLLTKTHPPLTHQVLTVKPLTVSLIMMVYHRRMRAHLIDHVLGTQ